MRKKGELAGGFRVRKILFGDQGTFRLLWFALLGVLLRRGYGLFGGY